MPKTIFCQKNAENSEKLNHSRATYLDAAENLKNKNFIQIYDQTNEYILQLMETNTTAGIIFLFLARHAENNNTIDIKLTELAEILNKTERTIRDNIKILEEINFLCKIPIGNRNIYFLNPFIVYNNKAEFKTKMLNTYRKYTPHQTTSIFLEIDNDKINKDKIKQYQERQKITYKFRMKNKDFQDPSIDELIEDLEQKELLNKSIKQLEEELQATKQTLEMTKNELKNINKLKEKNQEKTITEEEIFQAEFFMDFEDSLDMF